jgi:hypothetical protein
MAVINCGVTSGKEEEKKRRFCTAGEAIGRLDSNPCQHWSGVMAICPNGVLLRFIHRVKP